METFYKKVRKRGPDDCWIWYGTLLNNGYGQFSHEGRAWQAHRFAWALANGSIPAGMIICHKCDNRICVNPSHLFLGTNKMNSEDMVRKGRAPNGERGGLAKLTDEQVLAIRRDPRPLKEIAAEYGMHFSAIAYARRGGTWKHLPNAQPSRPRTRLTPDQVRAIRADTRPSKYIAADYGVSFQQVRRIIRREKWPDL